ncbi:PucR family transcriptional regulator [Peterkaempfera bronchialis]|uniref:PucR family transcriptional regulator n=1 Tax=Peterkaempfera bronchialis TaxID=2126346 RepID=A0A345T4K7_9ACTN|nr:helix-turn-helix domain-containing protein [Peterkaempfera bronchialis]AXI80912.1 PucR family transcriptional regulator [Peterkaempfera bronchialis]
MTTRREPNPDATGPSLSQLLRLIDPGMLDVLAAPRGTDIPVADVVLHDPGEDRDEDRAASGLVLLVVGVEAASPDAEDVLRAADRAGAAAVVMRRGTRGPRAALVAAAESGRTALLTRHPDRDWTEVLGRLRTALAHNAASGSAAVAGLRLGDLSGLANTVADLVGGAITIEDPQSRVLAYSRMDHEPDPMRRLTILGQEVPRWRVAELRESGFFQALWSTDDVVRRPADDRYAERLAIAVRHGSEVLGSLWAAADGRPLAEGAAAALRTAARAAVPHLVHHEAWGRAAARRREEAVQALLEGRPDAEQAARTVGVAPDRPHTVLVAEAYDTRALDAAAAPAADGAAEQRVLDVLALQAAAYRPGCVTARSGRRLFVLVPAGGSAGGGAGGSAVEPARQLVATARSVPHTVVFAGVGPVAASLSELPASREAAELVVRVLRGRASAVGAASAVSASAVSDDVASEVALLKVLDRVEPLWQAMSGPVHAMVAHDRAHGSEYGASVTAYLHAFGDTGAAAQRLNVHPNTLRYRLRRARELFGVDLTDPTGRLLADIGLRLAPRLE